MGSPAGFSRLERLARSAHEWPHDVDATSASFLDHLPDGPAHNASRLHLVTGEALDFTITLDRARETIARNRTALEFDGWKPEAFESTDRTVVRGMLAHLYGEALRTGPGRGLDRRKPEDAGWHVPQSMFFMGRDDRDSAIPARNIVAISIIDPDERSATRSVGFTPRDGDVSS